MDQWEWKQIYGFIPGAGWVVVGHHEGETLGPIAWGLTLYQHVGQELYVLALRCRPIGSDYDWSFYYFEFRGPGRAAVVSVSPPVRVP